MGVIALSAETYGRREAGSFLKVGVKNPMLNQKSTAEIARLIAESKMDFKEVVNKALNEFLPKIFTMCPYTEEPCTRRQCVDCATFKAREK